MVIQLWPFILGGAALGLDAYVIAGLLPAIAADLGTSASLAGLGVTVFTAAYALAGPLLAGPAGHRPGRHLTLALSIFTLGNLATVCAPGLGVFLLARALTGAAAGVYSPLSSAIAASLVSPQRRGRALGAVLAGLAVGTVGGVPLGLLLAQAFSWRVTMGLISAVGVCALLGVAVRRGAALPRIESPGFTARLRTLGRLPTLVTVGATLLTATASLGLYTFISVFLSGSALAAQETSLIWVWGVGGAVGALGIGRILDRWGKPLRVSVLIAALLVLTLVALGSGVGGVGLYAAIAAWGALGWASLAPQQASLLADNPRDGATVVSANASANYLGSAIGSGLGAIAVAAGITGSSLALYAAIPALLALLLHLWRSRRGPGPSGREPHSDRVL